MITKEHLRIYDKYLGDDDGFARCSTSNEKEYFKNGEWALIGHILQDLELVEKGLASIQYKENLNRKLSEEFELDAIEVIERKKKHNPS